MDRCWLLTWTCYGTWLPGDDRGFVSNIAGPHGRGIRLNQPRTVPAADLPRLQEYHRSQLACDPVWLTAEQAETLVPQFRETATHRGRLLFAAAVMANHVHLVVGVVGDPDPETLLRDFKAYASRTLNRRWPKPAAGTWWTESGSKRKKADDAAVRGAVEYVRTQPSHLVVWVDDDAVRQVLGERGA